MKAVSIDLGATATLMMWNAET